MKPLRQSHHSGPHFNYDVAEAPSLFQELLARGSTPVPEPSVLDGLLAKPVGGARTGRVICGCGAPGCPWPGQDGFGFREVSE